MPEGAAQVLIPPGVSAVDVARGKFAMKAGKSHACAPASGAVAVQKRGGNLRISVDRDALLQQSPGWLRQWTAEIEAAGCIPPGMGMDFAMRIVESMPLAPSAAYRLLHSDSVARGYVELGPENRLQTQAPIMKSGNSPGANVIDIASVTGHGRTLDVDVRESDEAIGVESSWYALRPKGDRPGATIVAVSTERRIDGQIVPAIDPPPDYFRFTPEIGFYRLIYKANIDGKGALTEIMVGAPDRLELERRTRRVLDDFDACKVSDPLLCAVIPRHVALNPAMAVTVNGREVRVGIGGMVRSAVVQAGGPGRIEDVLPTLSVRKPYGGKLVDVEFDRGNGSILNMMLLGGESISWK
ncbi:MAG: hypothetical protein WDO73_24560 [Ignavibacteriota bacterium]